MKPTTNSTTVVGFASQSCRQLLEISEKSILVAIYTRIAKNTTEALQFGFHKVAGC
jgi:hypothetical protein